MVKLSVEGLCSSSIVYSSEKKRVPKYVLLFDSPVYDDFSHILFNTKEELEEFITRFQSNDFTIYTLGEELHTKKKVVLNG